MPVPRKSPVIRLALTPALPAERAILERCAALSPTAQARWLRGLLLNGFLLECQQFPKAASAVMATPGVSPYLARARTTAVSDIERGSTRNIEEPVATVGAPILQQAVSSRKPLAHLKGLLQARGGQTR